MNSQRLAVKHIAKLLQVITKPKLVKELACPNAQQKMKICAKKNKPSC